MRALPAAAVIACLLARPALAQDWPQWRGPGRDAVVAPAGAPVEWPAALGEAWRVEVGEGYSSPIVAGGRAFVHGRRDPREVVTAIDLATGTIVWQREYEAAFGKNKYAARMAKGPNATPLVAAGRVFTLGVTGVLTAWDAAAGTHLWQKDFSKTIDTSKLFCGTSASPLLVDGLLVVQVGSDVHGGQVVALDPVTGKAMWEWRGPGPGYASPVVIEADGARQIVTLTDRSIVGLDARTGALLWSAPFPDEWHENIVTPLWTGTHLIVAGTRQGTKAYTLARAGGTWQATEAWANRDVSMYMSTPVMGDGVLYGISDKRKGYYFALDPRTGVVKWATQGREAAHASVLLTPRHVLFLTNGGELIVARRSTTAFEQEHKYTVASTETWAMPVLLGADLLVRDATALIRLAPGR